MEKKILKHIDSPIEIRKLQITELKILSKELRDFVIDIVSKKGGHLGASLGVVELSIAIHYVFNTPKDKLIWDVGHQAYIHKILTGRKNLFHTNRDWNGISGFPKISESIYDDFGTGHSSTSISAALGMAIASKLKGDMETQHIAVIGDASIASGMAFEGLNHAGVTDANLLIILNDNAMGIDPNIGALKNYLTQIKDNKSDRFSGDKNIFEALNLEYSGPIDGHDLPLLIQTLKSLKSKQGPKLLHIITTKGKGLKTAEKDQVTFHAPGKFDKITGELIPADNSSLPPKFQDVFGYTILDLAKKNEKIIGITPAMPTGSSLKYMMNEIPERAFDVGIAEQHAVTLAAGMAKEGMIPFCTIYSTFLQRAYDQLIHDVALQNLPVIFCIDRAGLVGADGPTHHGVFDIAFLNCIPNLIIASPRNEMELRNLLYTAQLGLNQPICIRYPRGRGKNLHWQNSYEKIEIGKSNQLKKGSKIAILSTGTIAFTIEEILKEEIININFDEIAWFDFPFIKPLDTDELKRIALHFNKILTIEDGVIKGGFGQTVKEILLHLNPKIKCITMGIPDRFISQGSPQELYKSIAMDKSGILNRIKQLVGLK